MEDLMDLVHGTLTSKILGAAMEVHRLLGPGLLESTYRECLSWELRTGGLRVKEEVPIRIEYRDHVIDGAYRADIIVEDTILLELKAVETVHRIHEAQLLTYLRHSRLKVGLLINFNVVRLKDGIHRFLR